MAGFYRYFVSIVLTTFLLLHSWQSNGQITQRDTSMQSYMHIRTGLRNFTRAVARNKIVTVAFLGGSITFNPGWREKVIYYLKQRFPITHFHFISAGIPSLGSLAHAFRLKQDVLDSGKVDLLFLEAAVNDRANHTDSITQIRSLEGIVRHAKISNPSIDIMIMEFADTYKIDDYNNGKVPCEVACHELVAEHYQVSSINLAKEVTDRIRSKEFSWKEDFKDIHPSPFGQQLYYENIHDLLELGFAKAKSRQLGSQALPLPLDSNNFYNGNYKNLNQATYDSNWKIDQSWHPTNNQPTRPGFVNVPMLISESPNSSLCFGFQGNAVGIAVVSGEDAGVIQYTIDDGEPKQLDLFTEWSAMLHLPYYISLESGLKNTKHKLTIINGTSKNPLSKGHACRIAHFFVNEALTADKGNSRRY